MILIYAVGDRPFPRPQDAPSANVRWVSPGFFRALGIPLLKGRVFDDRRHRRHAAGRRRQPHDRQHALARRATRSASASRCDDPHQPAARWLTVVGVVGDVRGLGSDQEPAPRSTPPQLQSPLLDAHPRRAHRRRPARARDAHPPARCRRSTAICRSTEVADDGARWSPRRSPQHRFNTVLLGLFAGLALVLAAVGVYGVVSYSVEPAHPRDRHPHGARRPVGDDVLGLVLGQGWCLVLIGLGVGLAGAFVATRQLASLVYGVSTNDPWTFAIVALALAAVALAANFLPARRATRIDPLIALRQE